MLAAEELNVVGLEASVTAIEASAAEGILARSTTFLDASITVGYESDGIARKNSLYAGRLLLCLSI